MLVWLIKDGENLPVQDGARRMRTGMLAEALLARGHSVVWWCSTFSHQRKALLFDRSCEVEVRPDFRLKLLHAGRYRKNISWRRVLHHRRLARRFREEAPRMPRPDAIVCAFPIIDLAFESVRFARERGIPIVVDVRDLWPDTLVERYSPALRPALRGLLRGQYVKTRRALQGADGLVAISKGCLRWGLRQAGREADRRDRVFYTAYPESPSPAPEPTERARRIRSKLAGKTVFSFVGSFGHSYELDLICEAARRAKREGHDGIHFLLAGDGERYEAVSAKARSLDNVTLTGWVDEAELKGLLAISHVGLVPCSSVADAMPNKAFEYLAAGLPILSSLEGEMEEIVATYDIGFSYRPGDVEAFFRRALALAADPELRERQRRNALALFLREFRAEDVYRAYAEHVEDIGAARAESLHGQAVL